MLTTTRCPGSTRQPAACHSRTSLQRTSANVHLAHGRALSVRVRAEDSQSGAAVATPNKAALTQQLEDAYTALRKAPPSQKFDFSGGILEALTATKSGGVTPKWGKALTDTLKRRNVMVGELRQAGIKNPDKIAQPSIRNDAAFLVSTVGITSVLAVAAGTLPGDWGFFGSYLIGGVSLVVLAIGSTAPGLLQVVIDKFSQVFPDYKERVVKHEAAHFLLGYLLGVPVTGYSLEIGREHTEFAEAKLQQRIIERQLSDEEIDSLAVVAVAGIALEGREYDEVMGQTADLIDLQRLLNRSKVRITDQQQQNVTRWAVFTAASLLRTYKNEHTALVEAMGRGASVVECVQAIESA